jgi:hypothetical protein
MDLHAALGFVGDDAEGSQRVSAGTLLGLIPIVRVATVGYEVQTARNVAAGLARPLPEWRDLGGLWWQGLGLAAARWIYGLPGVALALGPLAAALALLAQRHGGWQAQVPLTELLAGAAAAGLAGALLGGLYTLAYSFWAPAISAQYARHGRLGACFDWGAMLRLIERQRNAYVRAWLGDLGLSLGIGLGLGTVSGALAAVPCLGPLAGLVAASGANFVQRLWDAHLAGQLLAGAGVTTSSTHLPAGERLEGDTA